MKALLLFFAIGFAGYANAACEALPVTSETSLCTSIATQAQCEALSSMCYWDAGNFFARTPAQTKFEQMVNSMHHAGTAPTCDTKGAACYAEDSWTCCSGLCIDTLCD